MPPPFDLAVIYVAHNAEASLAASVASVREHAGECRVGHVVVDSGSTDATVAVAEKLGVGLVSTPNIGYGAGNNLGWRTAGRARYLLVLNPDATIVAGSLASAVAHADQRPRVGVFAPRIVDLSGGGVASVALVGTMARPLADRLAGRPIRTMSEVVHDVRSFDWAMGCALLIRAECFEGVGGFDERFFLYAEERDFLRSTRDAGWHHETHPSLVVCHNTSARTPNERLFAQRFRADLYYARKWNGRAGALATRLGLAADLLRRLLLGAADEWRSSYRAALRVLLTERVVGDPLRAREIQRSRTISEN